MFFKLTLTTDEGEVLTQHVLFDGDLCPSLKDEAPIHDAFNVAKSTARGGLIGEIHGEMVTRIGRELAEKAMRDADEDWQNVSEAINAKWNQKPKHPNTWRIWIRVIEDEATAREIMSELLHSDVDYRHERVTEEVASTPSTMTVDWIYLNTSPTFASQLTAGAAGASWSFNPAHR